MRDYLKIQLRSLVQNEDGATAIEYALIAGLIAIAIVAAVTGVGTAISTKFVAISGSVAAAGA